MKLITLLLILTLSVFSSPVLAETMDEAVDAVVKSTVDWWEEKEARLDRLATAGVICERFGHQWDTGWEWSNGGVDPTHPIYIRYCHVCDTKQIEQNHWHDIKN